jgi:hypothetical protein
VQAYNKPDGSKGKMLCLIGSTIDTANACRLLTGFQHPTLGGIDLGYPDSADETGVVEVANGVPDPTEEEIEARKAELAGAKKGKPKKVKLTAHRKGDDWAVGDVGYCCEAGEPYLGRIVEIIECDDDTVTVNVEDAEGHTWELRYRDLKLELPKVEEKKGRKDKMPKPAAPEKTRKAADGKPSVGGLYYVKDKDNGVWRGRLAKIDQKAKTATLVVENGYQGATTDRVVSLGALQAVQPEAAA